MRAKEQKLPVERTTCNFLDLPQEHSSMDLFATVLPSSRISIRPEEKHHKHLQMLMDLQSLDLSLQGTNQGSVCDAHDPQTQVSHLPNAACSS